MAINADKFLEVVKASALVDAEPLSRALDAIRKKATPQQLEDAEYLAAQLIAAGLLTRWQCDQLLKGRHKKFFLGKYKLLSHLGTGGMSSVYLAEHTTMMRRVAIKVLPSARVDDSSYLARFKLEARAAAQLDHPNIVRAYDIDSEDTTHYIVMEYVEGRDLQHIVKDDGPLPFDRIADYMMQAASGLDHAHLKGFVHRDIKPANLLLDKRSVIKVLDMGLAKFGDDKQASLTIAHDENVLGTADYLAPEQAINSHTVDCRADIYSLGCTMYFLFTGHPPFPDGTLPQRLMMHQTKMPPSILNDRPNAPAPLIDICMKMMAKRADDRPQSSSEIVEYLKIWLSGGTPEFNAPSAGDAAAPAPPRPGRARDTETAPRVAIERRRPGAPAAPTTGRLAAAGKATGLDDTIADSSRQDTMKGPGKSAPPARGGDSSKGRKDSGLRVARSIPTADDPLAFIGQEPQSGISGKDPTKSGADRSAAKDPAPAAAPPPAPERAKDARRPSPPRRTAGDSGKKETGGKKESGVSKRTAAAPSPGADSVKDRLRARRKRGELPQWLWPVVGVAFVASLTMVGFFLKNVVFAPPIELPVATSKEKPTKHSKDTHGANSHSKAPDSAKQPDGAKTSASARTPEGAKPTGATAPAAGADGAKREPAK